MITTRPQTLCNNTIYLKNPKNQNRPIQPKLPTNPRTIPIERSEPRPISSLRPRTHRSALPSPVYRLTGPVYENNTYMHFTNCASSATLAGLTRTCCLLLHYRDAYQTPLGYCFRIFVLDLKFPWKWL